MDGLVNVVQQENSFFENANKFSSQTIRKKYIKQHNIRRKKSKNYKKNKIRKNAFVRQSLKAYINDDIENYNYNYNLSHCSCDVDFNVNHYRICSECLQLAKDAVTEGSHNAVKTDGSEMENIQVQQQKMQEYFGYDYRLSKTKRSKWNIGKYIKNYQKKHGNYDRLYLLLDSIFRQSIYPRFLFFPNDIYILISKYIFGTIGRFSRQESKRAIAGIYWFANSINELMNNTNNQCEFEYNKNDNINKNNNNASNCKKLKKTFNILNFMYVGGNTLADMVLSNSSINHIDIVLDTYQLSRHFEQHLQRYHSKKHKYKVYDNDDHDLKNKQCKCIFWKYYYNDSNIVSRCNYWKYNYNLSKFDAIADYDIYFGQHKYTLNTHFILYLFREIVFKINNENQHLIVGGNRRDTRHRRDRYIGREHSFWYYNSMSKNLKKSRVQIFCCEEKYKIVFKRKYIYDDCNLKDLTFHIFNGDYNRNREPQRFQHNRLYTKKEIDAIERYMSCYSNMQNALYTTRQIYQKRMHSKGRHRRKKFKEYCCDYNYITIDVPLYPFKLEICHNYSTINSMYVDLNSFVSRNLNKKNKCKCNYNLLEIISQWKCNYNYNIFEINKRGLLDIERKAIIAPNINLINQHTIVFYFWKLVEYCEKLNDRQEINLWNIDDKYLSVIKKYFHYQNDNFWAFGFDYGSSYAFGYHEYKKFYPFIEKILRWNIKNFDDYYPHVRENVIKSRRYINRRKNHRKRRRSSTWRRRKPKHKLKRCCCYYKMKIDNHNNNKNNNNNNNTRHNVYFNRFKVFEFLGFDKMLKMKIVNDKIFRKKFVEMINIVDATIDPLPMIIELNCCLLQFDYLKYIKYDLNWKQCNTSSRREQYDSGYRNIHDYQYKFEFKIDDIIQYCEDQHKDHAPLSQKEMKREKWRVKCKEKHEMKRLVFNNWYYFGRFSQINTWLMDVTCFAKKKDKKLSDIYGKRRNFRKKKCKKHKLFRQTKKVSKRRSHYQRIMDKKKNKKSKREKYTKQNLMSLKQAYAQDYF